MLNEGVDSLPAARASVTRNAYLSMLVGVIAVPLLLVGSTMLADAMVSGPTRYVVAAAITVAIFVPMTLVMVRTALRQQRKTDAVIGAQAHRQEFESRLANALDMADGEPEVIDVIERSLQSMMPERPVELLLADNSHAHLIRTASASPTGEAPGCTVDSPDRCPAARRAQVQHFGHSDDLDACPKLRGRPAGAISAVCVPVSIMGRTVGVIHATGEPHAELAEDKSQDLGTLAKLAGTRIGLLRVMAETQLQAATDALTGLLNRRAFEQRVSALRRDNRVMAVAMADLDFFKHLNDTYGHETGDRALRLFAQVLSGSVRAQDVTCRHGGEEFIVALTGCTAESARTVLDGLRGRLDAAVTVAGLPTFTVSVGVVEAGDNEDLQAVIARADQALFQAKRDGRDRVVVHDARSQPVPVAVSDLAEKALSVETEPQKAPFAVKGSPQAVSDQTQAASRR